MRATLSSYVAEVVLKWYPAMWRSPTKRHELDMLGVSVAMELPDSENGIIGMRRRKREGDTWIDQVPRSMENPCCGVVRKRGDVLELHFRRGSKQPQLVVTQSFSCCCVYILHNAYYTSFTPP